VLWSNAVELGDRWKLFQDWLEILESIRTWKFVLMNDPTRKKGVPAVSEFDVRILVFGRRVWPRHKQRSIQNS